MIIQTYGGAKIVLREAVTFLCLRIVVQHGDNGLSLLDKQGKLS